MLTFIHSLIVSHQKTSKSCQDLLKFSFTCMIYLFLSQIWLAVDLYLINNQAPQFHLKKLFFNVQLKKNVIYIFLIA